MIEDKTSVQTEGPPDTPAAAIEAPIDLVCPLCQTAASVLPFDQRHDIDGRVCRIGQCRCCHVLINCTDLARDRMAPTTNDQLQALSSDQFYAVDADFLADLDRHVASSHIVDFLFEQVPSLARGSLMDFGASRGIVAASAARQFAQVYAVELTLGVLRQVHAHMRHRDRIHITDDLEHVPSTLDAIISMHVLEHLPELGAMVRRLAAKLNPGGAMLVQVPLLRNDYIVRTHYVFFNERAVFSLAAFAGLDVIGVWYDTDRDFLTAILRRPRPTASDTQSAGARTDDQNAKPTPPLAPPWWRVL